MGRFFLVNFGKTADYRPAYGIGQGKCTTGRTVRMVGMEAKRGRCKRLCREVVKKAEVYYNRDMPSADRNAKNPYQVSARYGFF